MLWRITKIVYVEAKTQAEAFACEKQGAGEIRTYTASPLGITSGPGWELRNLIARFGLRPAANCKCYQHMAEMNQRGPDWCEQNMDTITEWLRVEAERAGLMFSELGAHVLIRRAIRNARKKETRQSRAKLL